MTRVPDSLRSKTRRVATGHGHRLKRFVVWEDKAGAACSNCSIYVKINMSNPIVPPEALADCKDFIPRRSTIEAPNAAKAGTVRQAIAWLLPGQTLMLKHANSCGLGLRHSQCGLRNRIRGYALRHGGGKEYLVRHAINNTAMAVTCVDESLPVITLEG
jgi:hypothetical protein